MTTRCLSLGLLLAALALRCAPQDTGEPNIQAKADPLVVSETTIPPPKVATYQSFGYSGTIDGNTAVIGTPWYDTPWENTGGAWVFVRSSAGGPWTLQAEITASDKASMDHFGNPLALRGDTLAVGAGVDDDKGTDSGSAYVFVRSGTTWTEKAKLTASDGAAGDHFCVVGISEDAGTIAVGAADHAGKGAVYVFVGSGSSWTEQAKIIAPDGAAGDKFGETVDISGETLVIGASSDDDKGSDSGSVYVFVRSANTWSQQAKIVPADGAAGDRFGMRPDVDGDTLVVGARKTDDKGNDSGSAYVFERSGTTWTQKAKLTASDGAAGHEFGWGFLAGDTLAVEGNGAVYVFLRGASGWVEDHKITNPNESKSSGFQPRGTTATTVLVTALFSDVAGVTDAGYGYTYDLSQVPNGGSCTTNADCASAICAGGTCCATACAGTCNTCATGTCAPVAAGAEAGSCSGTSACDGAGGCKLKNGESCSAAAECLSGLCVDGHCCDGACDQSCESCAVAGKEGSCSPIPAGDDPDQECPGTDPACGGACDGSGQCAFPAVEQSCGTCKACDGAGACSGTPSDDDACGVIDCDLLDTSCKDYEDIKLERCAAFGQCKPANDPATCTSYTDLPCGTPDAGVDAQPETGPAPTEAGADMGQPKADESGCSCAVGGQPATDLAAFWLLAGLLLCCRRRRR